MAGLFFIPKRLVLLVRRIHEPPKGLVEAALGFGIVGLGGLFGHGRSGGGTTSKFTTKEDFYPAIGELVATWAEVERVTALCLVVIRKHRRYKREVSEVRNEIGQRLRMLRRMSDSLLAKEPERLANVATTFDAVWTAKKVRDDIVHGYIVAPFPGQPNLSVWDPLGVRGKDAKYLTAKKVTAATAKARAGERGLGEQVEDRTRQLPGEAPIGGPQQLFSVCRHPD